MSSFRTEPSRRHRLLVLLLLLAVCATGCSDDDPAEPAGPGDTSAPIVLHLSPGDHQLDVGVRSAVEVAFSEAMDTELLDVTLSSGGGLTPTWSGDGRQLSLAHAEDWTPGTAVDLVVGTGMRDAAGNALAQEFAIRFYVASPEPVLLDRLLPLDPDAMDLNGDVVMLFSEPLSYPSVAENITIVEVGALPKAVPAWQVGSWNGDLNTLKVSFLDDLSPGATYAITVGAATTLYGQPGTLGTDVTVTVTTGTTADETGPTILAVEPAVGTVVPTGTDRIVVTFSEPVDRERTRPHTTAAHLELFMATDPVWNAAGDEMTVYLQNPLPEGIRFYAVFDPSDVKDLAGNGNTAADSVSFTTAGTASLLPRREDLRCYYRYEDEDSGSRPARRMCESRGGGAFDWVLTGYEAGGFTDEIERWSLVADAEGIHFTAMAVEGGTASWLPALLLVSPDAPDTWSGNSATVIDGQDVVFAYTATATEPYREWISTDKADPYRVWLDDCVDVTIEYSMSAPDALSPFETGVLIHYYAPGLGVYATEQEMEFRDGDTYVGSDYSSSYLYGVALDDRYELLDRAR